MALISQSFINIVGLRIAYDRPVTMSIVFMCTVRLFSTLLVLTLFNMLLIKIGEVNKSIKESTAQHVKLLNGMHEGLIILSNATKDSASQF